MSRVSFFVHDLAANPIVRAVGLVDAVSRYADVEVLGFLHSGDAVYAPYRDRFEYKTIQVERDTSAVLAAIPRLAALATGDVTYACKPLVTSFGPALWRARVQGVTPLLLDVEDDEWIAQSAGTVDFAWRHVVKGWRHATAWKYTRALHAFVGVVDDVTVATKKLQRRYGGTLVRHGPDESIFNPDTPQTRDRRACRARWNLPPEARLALFAGVPRPHKGWNVLLDALTRAAARDWHLVLAGPLDLAELSEARQAIHDRCHMVGLVSNDEMPSLLAAADAVPVPQLDVPFAHAQLPAKVLDAMAMARPVITTSVGDLPEIIGNGQRGYLVTPGDSEALASAFALIAADPSDADARGRAAREWFAKEASVGEMARRLEPLITRQTLQTSLRHHGRPA